MIENMSGSEVTIGVVIATFIGNIIAMRVGYGKDISKNRENVDRQSKNIDKLFDVTDDINKAIVGKNQCKDFRDEFGHRMVEVKTDLMAELKNLDRKFDKYILNGNSKSK